MKKIKQEEYDDDLSADDAIEESFREESNNMQHEVKEIFSEDKYKARTDLSARQIKLVTKAYLMIELTGLKSLKPMLKDFLLLRISDSRQSRKEYVEGLKARIENDIQKGLVNVRGAFGK